MPMNYILNHILEIKRSKEIIFIAICGPADTGKSTISKSLCQALNEKGFNTEIICTDSFMIERKGRIIGGFSGYNHQSLKATELLVFLNNIADKKAVQYFNYDSLTGKNATQHRTIQNVEILIVEGIHALHETIRDKMDWKLFLFSDNNTLRKLRLEANLKKRGFKEIEAALRIDMEMNEYFIFLEPLKKYANQTLFVDKQYEYIFQEPNSTKDH